MAISLITIASKNAAADGQPAPTPPNSAASPTTPYRVQLYFTEPKNAQPGERVFDVFLQDKLVLQDFDIAAEAKVAPAAVIKRFDAVPIADRLEVRFQAKRGKPILSGIELQRSTTAGE